MWAQHSRLTISLPRTLICAACNLPWHLQSSSKICIEKRALAHYCSIWIDRSLMLVIYVGDWPQSFSLSLQLDTVIAMATRKIFLLKIFLNLCFCSSCFSTASKHMWHVYHKCYTYSWWQCKLLHWHWHSKSQFIPFLKGLKPKICIPRASAPAVHS
jgi:hypothetical protein